MITIAQIRALSRRIATQFNPDRIILFGSRARGRAHADSDVDLLVRTPQEIRRRLAQQDRFLADIVRRGKVLYEAAHP